MANYYGIELNDSDEQIIYLASIKVRFENSFSKKMAAWFGIKNSSYWDQSLLCAAIDGDFIRVDEAIKNGADINVKAEGYMSTPLILATQMDRFDIVSCLLKNGVDINYQNARGVSALMISCENDNGKIVFDLLMDGADLTLKNNKGETAKFLAKSLCCQNVLDVIEAYTEQERLFGLVDFETNDCPAFVF